jgi:hypothetical protein
MNSSYFEITEVVSQTQRLDAIHLQVMDVLERVEKTDKPWCSVKYLRDAIGYIGGGGWFTLALEIGSEKGYFWVVRCGHRLFVASKIEGYDVSEGDFIVDWMIRE